MQALLEGFPSWLTAALLHVLQTYLARLALLMHLQGPAVGHWCLRASPWQLQSLHHLGILLPT